MDTHLVAAMHPATTTTTQGEETVTAAHVDSCPFSVSPQLAKSAWQLGSYLSFSIAGSATFVSNDARGLLNHVQLLCGACVNFVAGTYCVQYHQPAQFAHSQGERQSEASSGEVRGACDRKSEAVMDQKRSRSAQIFFTSAAETPPRRCV